MWLRRARFDGVLVEKRYMRHERDGGAAASLEVVSGVDACVGPEQDCEACVLEWENRLGIWDQLVGETSASSGDEFLPEVVGQDIDVLKCPSSAVAIAAFPFLSSSLLMSFHALARPRALTELYIDHFLTSIIDTVTSFFCAY